jgi:hypothetical protein
MCTHVLLRCGAGQCGSSPDVRGSCQLLRQQLVRVCTLACRHTMCDRGPLCSIPADSGIRSSQSRLQLISRLQLMSLKCWFTASCAHFGSNSQ